VAERPTPKSVSLADHGVVDMLDARTPAHGLATPPYVERKVAEAKQETLAEAVKAKIAAWVGAGVLSAVTLAGVAFAYDKLEDRAKDAGTAAAKTEVGELKKTVEADHAVLEIVRKEQAHQSDSISEVQTDIRALYKAVLTGQRQDRLERPVTHDGGL